MEKNKITRVLDFNTMQLKLASTEDILEWSYGEVTRPETINYRTQRFEKDGLFCEKIFGPAKDWECYCGKYKRIRYKGIVCDKCGVEVTRSIVRRERMGHIQLAVPVSHIWFLRGVPSKVGLVLNLSPQQLENVIYFAGYIVTDVDQVARKESLKSLKKEYDNKIKGVEDKKELEKINDAFKATKTQLRGLAKMQILSEMEYYNLARKFGQVFEAEIGAEAINKLLEETSLRQEISAIKKNLTKERSGDKKKMFKRLKLLSGMLKVGVRPQWMMLKVIPIIPPDLRPMVQLDGGRFATSDLNDLYRRIINRNNRLKKLIELGAPEVIQRNEKRMLQEAVDALLDNSARRNQTKVAASTGQRRALKSVADMLKGKQGRFRQNLLGKRVDYSGRSVIVIGPSLKISQCGIPKKMALELFKPFIINKLIEKEYAHNVRIAGRMVDGEAEEAYEMLEEIISSQYVLLNRAPTLHRLSVQAFQPKLIEGKSIQIHPLVCSAFNADFDGDQMAVHVPLTKKAREECANIMLASKNLLKPSSGEPITVPSQDIVLGVYYMTRIKENQEKKDIIFGSIDELINAHQAGIVGLKTRVTLYYKGEKLETSAGRALINDILPEDSRYLNEELNKTGLKKLVSDFLLNKGNEKTVEFLDKLKNLGFKYATQSGISLGINDLHIPKSKKEIMDRADETVKKINTQYDSGLLTEEERKAHIIEIWNDVKSEVAEKVKDAIVVDSSIYSMIDSKARGSDAVVVQMAGMKGLVAGPTGETIELPIKGSLKEGFNVLEYFISTHGARKGMADTALRTATAGYLTRRLVDVSQDVVVREENCGDTKGSYLFKKDSDQIGLSFASRIEGRILLEDVTKKGGKKVIAKKGELVNREQAEEIERGDVEKIKIRSLVTCKTSRGVCQRCYGKDLGRNRLVEIGEAVGIVAAQAIGEPGTQLTMRTFHIGGIAGTDITQGLPRVDEIFETRPPKGEAIMAEFDGQVTSIEENKKQRVIEIKKTIIGEKTRKGDEVIKKYSIPAVMNLQIEKGDLVAQGQVLSEGHLDLKKLFKVSGQDALQRYVINEVQEIYQTQGEGINDKHLEIIIRQMLSRIKIIDSGDTNLLMGDIIEKEKFEESNKLMKKEGGDVAKGEQLVLGITKVALSTDSFLSAASFQETAKVLINAAIEGSEDHLRGLKENVIIGKLIPAGTGYQGKKVEEKADAK